MRIALIKIAALGDVVRTTAILPALRRRFPEMRLTWITSRGALEILRHNPDVLLAVPFDDSPDAQWRRAGYDWVISLDDEREMCRLASRLRAARLSGAYEASDGSLQYTQDMAEWFGMGLLRPADQGGIEAANELKRCNKRSHPQILYDALGLSPPLHPPGIVVGAEFHETADAWWRQEGLTRHRAVVGMNTGAGGRWEFKKWGVGQTGELARRIHDELDAGVVILGGPDEAARNAAIVAAAGRADVMAAPLNLNLLAFAALLARMNVLVTSDSLALHLGLAMKVAVVAFFGPTSAAELELYGCGEKIVTPLPCSCCYLKTCDVRPHCMASISVQNLFDAVRRCCPPSVRK